MKRSATTLKFCAALILIVVAAGCESTDGGSSSVSGGVYYGTSLYDPWYYGAYDYDADIIVTPPDRPIDRPVAPVRPSQPIYNPTPRPMPMPSIPSAPRASFR